MTTPATNFAWTIAQVETATAPVEGMEDVVRVAHYRVRAVSSDAIIDEAYGSVALDDPADPAAFVAFPELTEETVIDWVQAALAGPGGSAADARARIEAALEARIEALRNPPVQLKSLPWGQGAGSDGGGDDG